MELSNILNTGRRIAKFGLYAPISNIVCNYFGKYLSEDIKERIHTKRNIIIQKYLKPFVDTVNGMSFPKAEHKNCDTIWVCWFQGEEAMPEIARLCLSSIRQNASGHPVVLLTSENYKEFVDIPQIVIDRYNRGELKQAHFADILRINLLAQRGGLWLDATMIVTSPLKDEIFSIPFYSIKAPKQGHFVSRCRWAVFMLASNGNNLMDKVSKAFELYLTKTSVFADYFMFDHFMDMFYESDAEIKQVIDTIPMNNPNVHWLGGKLTDEYDESEFKEVVKDTSIFKLSTRAYSVGQLNASDSSYYAYLKRRYL